MNIIKSKQSSAIMETAGPITIGEYVYCISKYVIKGVQTIKINAFHNTDLKEYVCTNEKGCSYTEQIFQTILAGFRMMCHGINSTCLSIRYDSKSDIIFFSVFFESINKSTLVSSMQLIRCIDTNKIITVSRFKKYDELLEDHSRQIAKISELEKIILTMREEITSLKEETENSKYYIDLEPLLPNGSGRSDIINVRKVESVYISKFGKTGICVHLSSGKKGSNRVQMNHSEADLAGLQKVLNKLKYVKSISFHNYDLELSHGKDIFSCMNKFENVTQLSILNSEGIISIPDSSIFPKLKNITIKCSPNIKNLDILKKYESLETVQIDEESKRM